MANSRSLLTASPTRVRSTRLGSAGSADQSSLGSGRVTRLQRGYVMAASQSRLTASPTRARSRFGRHGGPGLARIKLGGRVRFAVVCHGWRMASPTRRGLASAGPGSIPHPGRDGALAGEAVLQWYVTAANASPTRGRLCLGRPGGTVLPGQVGSSHDRGGISWRNTPHPLPCSAILDSRCAPVRGRITESRSGRGRATGGQWIRCLVYLSGRAARVRRRYSDGVGPGWA
jgi:hypothetical protein